MTFSERLFLLDRLHHLIRRKGTGSPKALANRLEVSERSVYNLIGTLRELGAEIEFCTIQRSYYYRQELVFGFLPKVINDRKVKGGASLTLSQYLLLLR